MSALDNQRYKRLAALETRIGYVFEDRSILLRAMRHSSYGDGQSTQLSNERLEFLGDRVLGLLTARVLYDYSKEPEGTLARRLNALVRKEMCAKIARKIGLGDAILMSASEEKQGGRDKQSILGDCCEALIAAIYLDGGVPAIQTFYDAHWMPEFDIVVSKSAKDPKTKLQEMAMAGGHGLPTYRVVERKGPDHQPIFVIEVSVPGVGAETGTGKSKRDAERYAAQHLMEAWT